MADGDAPVLAYVLDFLQKKRLDVPPPLAAACPSWRPPPEPKKKKLDDSAGPSAAAPPRHHASVPSLAPVETLDEFRWALGLLSSLRERERRALARYVHRRRLDAACPRDAVAPADSESDADADGGDGEGGGHPLGPPTVEGGAWPSDVRYTNDYTWDDDVPASVSAPYRPSPVRRRAARPCRRTRVARIDEPSHPAHGQCGLFAAVGMAAGAWVIDYVGRVSLGENEDRSSDYVCDFGERSELALDARCLGNEARFVNDYRNTGRRPNVEFRLRRDRRGELRQGVYVCAKEGVRDGDELLISYGKSYWRSRVGCLDEFITRKPGEDAPEAARPPAGGAEVMGRGAS